MLLKRRLFSFIALCLLLLLLLFAVKPSKPDENNPSYAVSQSFIDFATPVFDSSHAGYSVIDNETLADVTADFLAYTEKYYNKNDWNSIYRYSAEKGCTIICCENAPVQPYPTETIKQVSGWPILCASPKGEDAGSEIIYIADAKISGSFSLDTNTGKIVSVSEAVYSDFKFYPISNAVNADVNLLSLAPFSSFSSEGAQFGCTFRLPYTFNKDALTHYLIDSQTNSSLLRLAVDGCPE